MEPGVVRTATFGILCVVILTSLPTSAQDPGCQKVRISGSTSLQIHLMTTYTITADSSDRRPVYISDTTNDRIYYVPMGSPKNTWFVGPYQTPGESGLYVEDLSLYANNIAGTFNIWDPETQQWTDAPYVQISCADPGYFGCFNTAGIDDVFRIPLGLGITVESCIEYCRNYPDKTIAALNMQDCICGSSVNHNSHAAEFCTSPCGGNNDQTCGGSERADVYQTWVGACGYGKQTGAIYSPKYPATYQIYDSCTWEISFDPDKVIKFYYNVWDVPAGDEVVITDKSGQSRTLGPDFDTTWTNEVTINFVSNTRVDGRFAVQYEAVDHCGDIGTTKSIAQISPSHGGNFAVGQQVTITCTDGTETVVECLQDKIFNVTGPYCGDSSEVEMTTTSTGTAATGDQAKGTSPTVVIVVVSVLAVLVLLAVLCVAVYFVIKKRKAKSTKRQGPTYPRIHLDRADISSPTPYVIPTADVTPDVTLTSENVTFLPRKPTDETEQDEHAHYEETEVGPLENGDDVTDREEELRQLYAQPMKKKKDQQAEFPYYDDPPRPEDHDFVDNDLYGYDQGGEAIAGNGGPSKPQPYVDNNLYGYN
ncbi:uncharacterized protein [Branchiostoma lanceolatum]|uniref:uncharacterized protein n=1 Tax=Branchiostoma lanceolatum TaxID=7740 RepID=UPI0034529AF9